MKAARGYESWKEKNAPNHKPWLFPEQMELPRLKLDDIHSMKELEQSSGSLDESDMNEEAAEEEPADLSGDDSSDGH